MSVVPAALMMVVTLAAVMVEAVFRQEPVAQLAPLLDPAVTRSAIVGEDVTHTTKPGDTLPKLAAWYGVDARVLASENQLRPGAALKPGQALHVPNRHIVPSGTYDGILINIPQPESIYHSGTRLHPDARRRHREAFNSVAVKTPVTVIYQPVLFGVASDGVYLEAHPDVYRKGGNAVAVVEKLAVEAGVADRIDWEAVRQVVAKREGVARPIARATGL